MRSCHPELWAIFWTPKILGAFPFDDRFRLSKKWLAYCFVVRLLAVMGFIHAFNNPSLFLAKLDEGLALGKVLRMVPFFSVLGEMFFCVIWWARKSEVVYSLMDKTWRILMKSKPMPKRNRVRLVHYLLLLSLVTCLFSYYTMSHENRPLQNMCYELTDFLITSSTWSSIGMFWDLLHLLGLLFEEHTRLFDESSVISYETFSRLSEMVNDIFQLKLLFTITTFFIYIIFYLYILLLPLHPGFNGFSLLTAIHAVKCIVPVVIIISACEHYTNQEKKFNQELCKRIIEDKSWMSHRRNEKLNFHCVVRQETKFSACDFFTIDRPLLCSMISAATTYLVIILQYGNEDTDERTETSTV